MTKPLFFKENFCLKNKCSKLNLIKLHKLFMNKYLKARLNCKKKTGNQENNIRKPPCNVVP
jgi:hypothetical protein